MPGHHLERLLASGGRPGRGAARRSPPPRGTARGRDAPRRRPHAPHQPLDGGARTGRPLHLRRDDGRTPRTAPGRGRKPPVMIERLATALELARKGYWTLFAAKTLRTLRLHAVLDRLTCRIAIPGEPPI